MTAALVYLVAQTTRNRVVSMARRVREPRYAIGFAVVAVYLTTLVLSSHADRRPSASLFQRPAVETFTPIALALMVLPAWLLGNGSTALSYTLPEVSMLFPAPLTRRQLLGYKLMKVHVGVLVNAALFAFVFRLGSPALAPVALFVAMFVVFATLALHRVGAALSRTAALAHGARGLRKTWSAQLVAVAIPAVVVITLATSSSTGAGASALPSMIDDIARQFERPLPHAALTPFRLLAAPVFAPSIGAWLWALGPALAILALHIAWVMRTNAAFEEAAAEASTELATRIQAIKTGGLMAAVRAPRPVRFTLSLRATGHPIAAIVWKNTLCFVRTFKPAAIALVAVGPAIGGVAIGLKAGDAALAVAGVSAVVVFAMIVGGGVGARNDLRGDLQQLALIKTFPLSGTQLMLSEVLSFALPQAALQCVICWGGLAAVEVSRHRLRPDIALAIAATLPIALVALNVCSGTLRNGVTILFPGWVRLGVRPGDGIEALGQAMVAMLLLMLSFVLLMVVPGAVAAAAVAAARVMHLAPGAAVVIGVTVASAVLAAECYALMLAAGGALARLEPSEVEGAEMR